MSVPVHGHGHASVSMSVHVHVCLSVRVVTPAPERGRRRAVGGRAVAVMEFYDEIKPSGHKAPRYFISL